MVLDKRNRQTSSPEDIVSHTSDLVYANSVSGEVYRSTDGGEKWEKLPRESLASMHAVRYKSSDGLEIPAYLTLPKGIPGKGLPTVIVPHGGPWARDEWGYNPLAQFFANRGYAVLMPNFRGSSTE